MQVLSKTLPMSHTITMSCHDEHKGSEASESNPHSSGEAPGGAGASSPSSATGNAVGSLARMRLVMEEIIGFIGSSGDGLKMLARMQVVCTPWRDAVRAAPVTPARLLRGRDVGRVRASFPRAVAMAMMIHRRRRGRRHAVRRW